jgi:hypothetical protein
VSKLEVCGLLLHPDYDLIATSVDGLVSFNNETKSYEGCVEIKTHGGDAKVMQEIKKFVKDYKKVCFSCIGDFSDQDNIDRDDINLLEFFGVDDSVLVPIDECLTNPDYRTQVLQHAVASQLKLVVFIEASPTEIIRIVMVLVSSKKIYEYEQILLGIHDKYLKWVYGNQQIPIFSSKVLGYCTDMHSLKTTLALWKAAYQLYLDRQKKPYPFIKHLNETLLTLWNYCKGGVDVLTRLQFNNKAGFQHLGVEPRLWDLLVMQTVLTIATIFKWISIENKIDTCKTTDDLKNCFHRNCSVKEVLINVATEFRSRAETMEKKSCTGTG